MALKEYATIKGQASTSFMSSLSAQVQEVHLKIYEEFDNPIEKGYNKEAYGMLQVEVQKALMAWPSASATNSTDVQLPRISIPKFDGELIKWRQFFDFFSCMVHETNMPTIKKMWYLKTALTGDAERATYPLGSGKLRDDFYGDDCLTGSNSIAESKQIADELNKILVPNGFKLRKWCSTTNNCYKEDIQLWETKLEWGDELPEDLQTEWKNYRDDLLTLDTVTIPRHIYDGKIPVTQELHTFVDASARAYGAAFYVRAKYKNNQVSVRLLYSKSRVAPKAQQTLPRLELCAAVLGAELSDKVRKDLSFDSSVTGYYWSDSMVVLSWINAAASTYHIFVANKIAKIQAITSQAQWRHVSSANNAADVLSRGILASKLGDHNLWFSGPLFLHGSSSQWTSTPDLKTSDLERRTKYISLQLSPTSTILTAELHQARIVILRTIQQVEFAAELSQLQRYRTEDKKNRLVSLSPILGNDGLIRVGGRLENSALPYESKHQILLPYNDPIVKMLLRETHEDDMHCGAQALRAIVRQQHWILNEKIMSRSIIHNCLKELETTIFTERAMDQIISQRSRRQVDFRFIPPRAPSFGGLWEAAVKSAKKLLLTTSSTASLKLNTLIVEVEAILNYRPITPISNDPTDMEGLTPGHL
ncbi:uncharacterized protein [Drosophila takahashii]|uniref:uncharacterized protein n=1 Tax=Drosophila takahashii TaxID=29030 RepID=UPI003898EB64